MRLYSFVAAAALLSASLAARADSVLVENFATGGFSASDQFDTTLFSVNGFNPALGTLNSVAIQFSGTYVVSNIQGQGAAAAEFYINAPGFGDIADAGNRSTFSDGTYAASASGSDSFGPGLAAFTTAGPVTLELDVFAEENTIRNATPNGFDGTVTYDYTPAATPVAATPEPSSLALLGTGLLGALGVARKRFA